MKEGMCCRPELSALSPTQVWPGPSALLRSLDLLHIQGKMANLLSQTDSLDFTQLFDP